LRECTFILAPALEEGQAGAVLDGVRRGLIPIVSRKAGIDFSPLGHIEPHLDSPHNVDVLARAVGQTPDQLRRLQRKTIEYYKEYHEDFLPALDETVRGCMRDKLYPLVSITLPIYNKEKTIEPLLKRLHSAAVEYGNVELHVIFDGCEDGTEDRVRRFFAKRHDYPTTFDVTPNIFEVRSNNLGLKQSTGKYCVIVQDDNYIYDKNIFFEAVTFLEKNARAAILGCLAGVNFYPRGTYLEGSGQIAMSGDETYWRQDALTDPDLKHQFFQADACMRGPLVIRKSFLEQFGYLDEIYAPLYMDDMDIGFRAASHGLRVYCMLSHVENKSLTMAHYDDARNDFFARVIAKNTRIFYERWSPGTDKDYARVDRAPVADSPGRIPIRVPKPRLDKYTGKVRRALRYGARVLDSSYCQELAQSPSRRRSEWVRKQVGSVGNEGSVLTARPEDAPAAGNQVTFVRDDRDRPEIADLSRSPASADVVVFADALERLTDPLAALREASGLLKPGGRLIVSASARGTGRGWHEQALTRAGFHAISITADGGLFANVAQTLWRGHEHIIGSERPTAWRSRVGRRILQVALFNAPTIVLNKLEQRWPIEDSSGGYLLVATPLERELRQ
jgi:glycosyltransferase involved in cell wall biosynthesis